MVRQALLLAGFAALSVFAGNQKGESKVDSIVYDVPNEWRIFSAGEGGQVVCFALQGTILWSATETEVSSISTTPTSRKGDVQVLKTLGTLPSEGIQAIVIDKQNAVWFGGKNGLAKKSGAEFTTFTDENGLPSLTVNCLAAGTDGTVWIGTDDGLCSYSAGTLKTYTTKNGLTANKIQKLAIDAAGALWCGTPMGISVFNGVSAVSHTMKSGLSWNDTKALAIDPENGTVWAAVGEKDVNSLAKGTWNVYMDIQSGISAIMVDTRSRIWFGSDRGLIKFNGEEWIADPKQLGVPAAQVSSMYRDDAGNLWFGMENGVIKLDNPYPF